MNKSNSVLLNGNVKWLARIVEAAGVIIVLFLCEFAESPSFKANDVISHILLQVTTAFRPDTQWTLYLLLAVNLVILCFVRFCADVLFCWQAINFGPALAFVLFSSTFAYALGYSTASQSVNALLFLAVVTLGQAAGTWCKSDLRYSDRRIHTFIFSFLFTLLTAAFWQHGRSWNFEYRGVIRAVGPWENPNLFGLLMGAGTVLAAGLFIQVRNSKTQAPENKSQGRYVFIRNHAVSVFCFLVAIVMFRELLLSYSRGAWIATFCGLLFLICSERWASRYAIFCFKPTIQTRQQVSKQLDWCKRNLLPLAFILIAVGALCFWFFQKIKWLPAQRVLSMADAADFSWRNRIAAWEGALQIIAEHPWFGTGWNQSEPLYTNYYLPPKLAESAAIQMNDYLTLGVTLGVPALICFIVYIWLSLAKKSRAGMQGSETDKTNAGHLVMSLRSGNGWTLDSLPTICRAGAIVLVIDFWFDGGLFKLATASVFWILLELGRQDLRCEQTEKFSREGREEYKVLPCHSGS